MPPCFAVTALSTQLFLAKLPPSCPSLPCLQNLRAISPESCKPSKYFKLNISTAKPLLFPVIPFHDPECPSQGVAQPNDLQQGTPHLHPIKDRGPTALCPRHRPCSCRVLAWTIISSPNSSCSCWGTHLLPVHHNWTSTQYSTQYSTASL